MLYLKIIILYAVLVFVLHIVPTGLSDIKLNDLELWIFRVNYIVHVLIFLPWMYLVSLYLNKKNFTGKVRTRRAIQLFGAGLVVAVLAEMIQIWFPYRSFSIMDLIFNVSGIIIGALVFIIKPLTQSKAISK